MREIKLRAWTRKWGMVDSDSDGLYIDIHARTVWNNFSDEEGVEIMQFTGLTDKNGVEIYEGDILRCGEKVGAVTWNNDNYGRVWTFSPSYADHYYGRWFPQESEVIGNIYENPELLK